MDTTRDLPRTYDPAGVEPAITKLWLQRGAFAALPDERPRDRRYVIMMPLPNVTGALHMGHAMDNVMQDLLIRWHRMMGDNTLWMPGTDHAGIATQAVVEKRLKELEGKTRHDLGREGLVDRIWQWKDQYQARIIAQQQRMGCSCDWERQRFTMDPVCARAVRHMFFKLFRDGLVVRGKRLVNWDPFLQTSISDDEVYHEAVQGHFWYMRYPVIDPRPGEPTHVVVATTRPETMLGDTAVACHPAPEAELARVIAAAEAELAAARERDRPALEAELARLRAREVEVLPLLVRLRDMAQDGRMVRLPLLERPMPLILDAWAKPELGTGCVKITPAHDANDYAVWTRHPEQIGVINILNPDGTLNEAAGAYQGLDRFVARERVLADLEAQGLLERVEDREIEIGHSDRSKTPIEPYLSDQWFITMGDVEGGILMGAGTGKEHRSPGLVQAAMDAVVDGRVAIHPQRYTKTYLDWLAEKRDWPVSRQLWWGHRIPVWTRQAASLEVLEIADMLEGDPRVAWHAQDGVLDICLLEDDPALLALLESEGFQQDPDVLDTWFSSSLWPFSTLGWPDPASAPVEPGQRPLAAQGAAPDALDFYYPGSCLVTGRDIITLWVARMVLAGLYCLGDIPFSDVFIHANILDGKGERMSKSKGNGIDPVDVIGAYGTDAMRYVLCDMQTGTQDIRLPVTATCPVCGHGNDLGDTRHGGSIFTYLCGRPLQGRPREGGCGAEFDVLGTLPDLPKATLTSERFDIGRGFCTKLWNSARFAFLNLEEAPATDVSAVDLALEDRWLLHGLDAAVEGVQRGLADYNPSAALSSAREFFWAELCDWYLEIIKPRLTAGGRSAAVARAVLAFALDQVLRLLHPFVPYITEHLWQLLGERAPVRGLGSLATAPTAAELISAPWPEARPGLRDEPARALFGAIQLLVGGLREFRSAQNLPLRQPLEVTLRCPAALVADLRAQGHLIANLVNLSALHVDPEAARLPGMASKVVGEIEVLVHDAIDAEAERQRLRKELERVEKEIGICEKKLTNPSFTERAPAAVVAQQRERQEGYEAQRQAILESLGALG
ncbi:MAG: valine--tRNA ligase [Pseudomonadota bacterium]